MSQVQPTIAINPRSPARVSPNIAPLFLGAHRSFGLFVGSTMLDYRISLMGDHRDGAGWQESVSLVYQNTDSVYADMMSYGSPEAFMEFVLGRIAEAGKMLPPPTEEERSATTTGLTQKFQPLPATPYPTDEWTALNWLQSELSRKQWTLENGYLQLV